MLMTRRALPDLHVLRLGRTPYAAAWDLQRELFRRRVAGTCPDLLLLTEHDPVYTFGTGSDNNHLLAGEEELRRLGAAVYHVERGGDVTFHGPGQLVGYPILNLSSFSLDAHGYLRAIEEVIIRSLADYGVTGGREPEYTGVWVNGEKIAAIGVRISHWVTMHGFAWNIATDLSYFGRIIPCGIFHRGVTSLERCTGKHFGIADASDRLVKHVADVFGCTVREADPEQFRTSVQSQETQECLH